MCLIPSSVELRLAYDTAMPSPKSTWMRDLWRSPCGERERIKIGSVLLLTDGIGGVAETNWRTVTGSDGPEEQPALTCQTTMAAKDASLSCNMQHLVLPLNILTP